MADPKSPKKPKIKPLLRGMSHQLAALLALFAGAHLTWRSLEMDSKPWAPWGSFIYSVSLFLLFAISALYHRPHWNPRARALMRRLDHAAIALLIAGSSTAIGVLTLQAGDLTTFLIITWAGALLGIAATLFWIHAPKPVTAGIYVVISILAAPFFSQIWAAMGRTQSALLVLGGALYILGASIYALRRPDPFPRVFGYHEIFHLLVIAAAACHYGVILRLVLSPALGHSLTF